MSNYTIFTTTSSELSYPASVGDEIWVSYKKVIAGVPTRWSAPTYGILKHDPLPKMAAPVVQRDSSNLLFGVSWDFVPNAGHYQIKYNSIVEGGEVDTQIIPNITSSSINVPSISGETKRFAVRAVRGSNYGAWSNFTQETMTIAPAWITNGAVLEATQPTPSKVKLTWQLPNVNFDRCVGYDIAVDDQVYKRLNTPDITATFWTVMETTDRLVVFKIRALSAGSNASNWTHEVAVPVSFVVEVVDVPGVPTWPGGAWVRPYFDGRWRAKWTRADGASRYMSQFTFDDGTSAYVAATTEYASTDDGATSDYATVSVTAQNIVGVSEPISGQSNRVCGWSYRNVLSVEILKDSLEFLVTWPKPDLGGRSLSLRVTRPAGQGSVPISIEATSKKIRAAQGEQVTFEISAYEAGIASEWSNPVTEVMSSSLYPAWTSSYTPSAVMMRARMLIVVWRSPDINPDKVIRYHLEYYMVQHKTTKAFFPNSTRWTWRVPDYIGDTFKFRVRAEFEGGYTWWSEQKEINISSPLAKPRWVGSPGITVTHQPNEYRWEISCNVADGGSSYHVAFAEDTDFEAGSYVTEDTTSHLASHLTRLWDPLYVRIRPISAQGVYGDWSGAVTGAR